MYKKYQRIKLSDILDERQIAINKNELLALTPQERQKLMPHIEHYILVAIRKRFPDIPKNTLRKKCLRIARQEFAFAYPQ